MGRTFEAIEIWSLSKPMKLINKPSMIVFADSMKRLKGPALGLALLLTASLTGCVGTGRYLVDRGRDMADIVTIGLGAGAGAKVRVGPVQTGLIVDVPFAALRGGQFSFGMPFGEIHPDTYDLQGIIFGAEAFRPESTTAERGKLFIAETDGIPFISFAKPSSSFRSARSHTRIGYFGSPPDKCYSYYTQIEAAGGLLGTARVGVNPGELLDFILGWIGIDIYDDDLELNQEDD